MSVNKVILLGRLGKDPETRVLDNGSKVCNFSLATSENYKDKDGNKKESAEWHNIVMWGKTAEFADKYLKKGSQVYLEGKKQTRSWEKDGNKMYTVDIVCHTMQFVSGGNDSSNVDTMPSNNTPDFSDS